MCLDMMENYQQTLSHFAGPAEVLAYGNALQLKDYSMTLSGEMECRGTHGD